MHQQTGLASIHLRRKQALLSDGQIIPITNIFDHGGDETDDLDFAVSFVAGPDKDGQWHTDDVGSYSTRVTIN